MGVLQLDNKQASCWAEAVFLISCFTVAVSLAHVQPLTGILLVSIIIKARYKYMKLTAGGIQTVVLEDMRRGPSHLYCFLAHIPTTNQKVWIRVLLEENISNLCAAPNCYFFQHSTMVNKVAKTLISYSSTK